MTSDTRNTINIVISGVGGQGVLTLAEILAKTALACNLNVRVGEIHGMAQRGGHVVCTVRIGPNAYGPIIDNGTADILVGFEPVETLREIATIKPSGIVLLSTHVQYPVAVSMGKSQYPSHKEILSEIRKFTSNIYEIDAMKFAKDAGSSRSLNMVMLGAIIGTGLTPLSKDAAIEAVSKAFSKRFESINTKAVESGYTIISNAIA
ncbi:MAG: Indolepyruvate oxidoreductase subunit IorB [Candidatus Thorarchaeota archaeon]|nr:MAG: Indolepyruvate oxidoreductase subunit IorB [Candidatus Thorarchaeota archaeon]